VTYDDMPPWPLKADGDGYSLIPLQLKQPNRAANWTHSFQVNGSPGKDDPMSAIHPKYKNHPNIHKTQTVCRVGKFRFLIPYKKDFQVSVLNLQGRTIAHLAEKGELHYQWIPENEGLFFIRFKNKNGGQVVKKVLIVD
jgi:hypothetical protein